jgi:16S rRNA (guanine(1405)-N(7))-methyltransferase
MLPDWSKGYEMKSEIELTNGLVDQLLARVKENPKYRFINEPLIRRIGENELEKRLNLKEAVKATRNKLHQIGGAYIDHPINYTDCLSGLISAYTAGNEPFLQECRRVMCYHSSTRERLPYIEDFYHTILAGLPPARRVLDIACGLNPLAFPWMGLPVNVDYLAFDIYGDMIHFINEYMNLVGINGSAYAGDVISNCPAQQIDIAFVLKTIPCLEQVDKNAGVHLLKNIQAKHLVISFPVHSLGGRRDKGMLENYTRRFYEILAEKDWPVKRYEYPGELVFVVSKS